MSPGLCLILLGPWYSIELPEPVHQCTTLQWCTDPHWTCGQCAGTHTDVRTPEQTYVAFCNTCHFGREPACLLYACAAVRQVGRTHRVYFVIPYLTSQVLYDFATVYQKRTVCSAYLSVGGRNIAGVHCCKMIQCCIIAHSTRDQCSKIIHDETVSQFN